MSRDGRRSGLTRRRLLAVSGTGALAALAGCSGILSSQSTPTVDGDALAEVVAGEAPTVPETLPVEIESSFVAEQRTTAESDLGAIPAPFDREEIPNGVIRERLNRTYESATESIDRIGEARTPYDRLGRANAARVDAREVRAAWRAITEDLTRSALREEAPAIESGIDEIVARWSYVGDDPVRAVVVHDEISGEIRAARNWLSSRERRRHPDGETALGVGGLAADHERARTSVAVASYVFDRFRASLGTRADLQSRFEATRETLRSRVVERSSSLPPEDIDDPTSLVDRDVGETTGVRALAELGTEARYRADNVIEADDAGPHLARDVLAATSVLVYVRAYESLRERIEDGDDLAVERVEDVAAVRESAIDAIESAREADDGELLVDAILPRFANDVRWTDDRFARESGSVNLQSVAYDAIDYVVAAATCRAVVPVSAETASVLRDA